MVDKKDIKRHVVMDLESGEVYGIALNKDDTVFGVEPFGDDIPSMFGVDLKPKQPQVPAAGPGAPKKEDFPYGKTTFAIDLSGSEDKNLFTIVWPEKEELEKGAMPHVAIKPMPDDLLKAGLAGWPNSLKSAVEKDVENEEALKKSMKEILNLVGLDNVKKDLKQNIAMARFIRAKGDILDNKSSKNNGPSLHLVFSGNPGTGKTTVAREYAKVLHSLGFIRKPKVHEVTRTDLVGEFVGKTGIKTREAIEKAKGGVLFIDEAYALTLSNTGNDFGKEAIAELVAAMENDRDDLVVIVAGYPEPMKGFIDANEGLKSRFQTYLNFEDYNINELAKIMDFMLDDRGYSMDKDAKDLAIELMEEEMCTSKKSFGNGRTVRNLVDKAEKSLAFRLDQDGSLKQGALPKDEMKRALTTFTLADIKEVDLSGISSKAESTGFFEQAKTSDSDDNKTPASPPAPTMNKFFS